MENTQEKGTNPKNVAVETQGSGNKAFKRPVVKKPVQKPKTGNRGITRSLAGRISLLLCVSMLVVFVLVNFVLINAVGKSFDKVNQDYLHATTAMNVEKINESITLTENTAKAISDHLNEMYAESDEGEATQPSLLRDTVLLTERRAYEERYLLDSIWEMIRHDEYIMGAGVLFEKNELKEGENEYAT